MYKNGWSFSLYQASLHHIFTHILLFSTPAFIYIKLLCVVLNMPGNFPKVYTFLLTQL
jgi:hypothetical protein